MPNIYIKRGLNNALTAVNPVLGSGEMVYVRDTNTIVVGNGSGVFSSLSGINATPLTHSHVVSDITNFNSSVSGLLPTIANSGDNRVLTSTGSSVGINAEANLTFNGSLLNVVGSGSFSSQTVFASGTAAAPGISIVGDTDTGIGQLSANGTNSLSIMTSGVERVTINSAGNVGIGAAPAALLDLGSTVGVKVFTYKSGGANAGVGTDLSGNAYEMSLFAGGTADTHGRISFGRRRVDTGTYTERMVIDASGTVGIASASTAATYAGWLRIGPMASSSLSSNGGLEFVNAASSSGWGWRIANLDAGAGSVPLVFQNRSNSTSWSEILRITEGGNVGIGTSSPSVKLDVYGADAAISVGTSSYGRFQTSGGNAIGYMYGSFAALGDGIHLTYNHYHNAAGTLVISNSGGFTSRITAGYGAVMFATSSAANVAPTERMRITSDGNVGIGTSSPSTKLQINGQTRVTDGTTNIDFVSSSAVGYIGTQTNHPLVLRTNDTERMRIDGSGNSTFKGRVDITSGTTAGAQTHFYVRPENGALGRDSQITLGCTFSNGWGGADYVARDAGAIRFGANGGSADPRDWSMRFLVANGPAGSDTPRECMRITAAGRVGIGTSSPAELLHIRGAGARAYIYNTTTDAVVIIQGLTPASPWLGAGKSAVQIDVDGWGGFAWQTDVTSGAKLFKLINNGGYGASESTFITINNSGQVGIGISPSTLLHLNSLGVLRLQTGSVTMDCTPTAGATDSFVWNTSANAAYRWSMNGTERMRIESDGKLYAYNTYGTTVGATNRDLFIDSGGLIGYVSSIRASKTNITTIDNVSWLRDLTPVSFFYRRRNEDGTYSDEPDGTLDYGLIAEDVEVVAPELCFYDIVDDNPELRGVHYSKLITPMLKYIQQLEDRIVSLETRLGDNV